MALFACPVRPYIVHIYVIPQDSPMVVKGVTANDSRQDTGAGEKQPCKEAKEVLRNSDLMYFFGWFLLLTEFSLIASWQSHPKWVSPHPDRLVLFVSYSNFIQIPQGLSKFQVCMHCGQINP